MAEINEITDMDRSLVRLCIETASENSDAVEKWRLQKRSLERMPSQLAEALLHRLLRRRLLYPSLLEVFQHNVEEIDLRGENSVDAEWMAYLGGFHYLRSLSVADCHRMTSSALWAIAGMSNLKELDLSRCLKVTDAGMMHLLSIPTLEKLSISETGVSAKGIMVLSSLRNLLALDLGGVPVTDLALCSLKVLKKLEYLDLWGSKISNEGAATLDTFPKLSFLNIAWTNVTRLPNLPSLTCLNMSNCDIVSLSGSGGNNAPLAKLILSGASFVNIYEAILNLDTSSLLFLDFSRSPLDSFDVLGSMNELQHLDLSFSKIDDDSIRVIVLMGENLKYLNLSNTGISSAGVGILCGNVPNLETISLSHTLIDDVAVGYFGLMPALKVINLNNTKVKGMSLMALESLNFLERLDMEDTLVKDPDFYKLSSFKELRYFSLKSSFLTDMSLTPISSIPNLTYLAIRDAILTNSGLYSFRPPAFLAVLDLRGCWLLTEDAVSSFCKKHPKIEVRHEFVTVPTPDPNASSNGSSSSRETSKLKHKCGKLPNIPSRLLDDDFVDQRLKYSRVELFALQHSCSGIDSLPDREILP